MVNAKDFIETVEGLLFAVVQNGLEHNKALCFLRYVQRDQVWFKCNTDTANAFLAEFHPEYLHYSAPLQAKLHGVARDKIKTLYSPRRRLQELIGREPNDIVESDCLLLSQLFQTYGIDMNQIGVTGSLLPRLQNPDSDIDLVVYDRAQFHLARAAVRDLLDLGRLGQLSQSDWLVSYNRRNCDLSESEYVWHERRKFNKALVNSRKFDLSFVDSSPVPIQQYQKGGLIRIEATVTDDFHSFDYPAVFLIDHPEIRSICCFTATYSGQAKVGEKILVSGVLEFDFEGRQRIIVGSNREARGEFIKVIARE